MKGSSRNRSSRDEAIKFYNERIKNFANERQRFAHYVTLIKPNARELHTLEWELKKKGDDGTFTSGISSEEKVVASAEVQEFEATFRKVSQDIFDNKSELDELLRALAVKRGQIEQMQKLPQPVQRDVTYMFDDKYSYRVTNGHPTLPSVPAQPKSSLMKIAFGLKTVETITRTMPPAPPTGTTSQNSASIGKLKTGEVVKRETEVRKETDRIIDSLNVFQDHMAEAKEFIGQTLQQANMTIGEEREETKRLIEECDSLDNQCFLSVSELLKLRAKMMVAQREEFEELDNINREKVQCSAKEVRVMEKLRRGITGMRENVREEMNEMEEEFGMKRDELEAKIEKVR